MMKTLKKHFTIMYESAQQLTKFQKFMLGFMSMLTAYTVVVYFIYS